MWCLPHYYVQAASRRVSVDFIFMLTRGDKTIEDCLELFALVAPLGLRAVGFKDVGVSARTLGKLTDAIRRTGAQVCLEVVSQTDADCLRSARMARDLQVDQLFGGTRIEPVLEIIGGTAIDYYPFPGRPTGHPTRLGGSPAEVEEACARYMAAGCAGADLLAYRATEADPVDLVRAARRGLGQGRLVVAGSVGSRERIKILADVGADAFTIGSALFDGSYSPNKGSILSQLSQVLSDCKAVAQAPCP